MAVTSNDIANQVIQYIGDNQPNVTGQYPNFDNSAAGTALNNLYGPAVQTVARQFGYDFSRNTAKLALSGNTPLAVWPFEYLYPTNGIEVRQLIPGAAADPNNPVPVNWDVCNTIVSGANKKVIQTDVPNALAVFTNQPSEDTWDPLFREAVVRLLASELAIAIDGRPETANHMLESAGQFSQASMTRQD